MILIIEFLLFSSFLTLSFFLSPSSSLLSLLSKHLFNSERVEEFLLILPNTSEENAFLFAERFRKDIERMEFIPAGEEENHPITISGGISTYPCIEDTDEDANTIIRYAEHALYNAKKRGKNKIVQFSKLNLGE